MRLWQVATPVECSNACGCDMKHKLQISGVSVAVSLFYLLVQWRGRTALMRASEGGHVDVVKELLGAQAGVDLQDEVCCLYLQL